MIELSNIDFKYKKGDFSLKFDEMKIEPNKAAAIIGPSGCGKTTLMNLISGILEADSGRINVNDIDVHELNDRQRRLFRIQNIGFVFQDFALLDYLTVFENILHPYRINPALKLTSNVKERAKELAEEVGITKRLNNYSKQTSYGEQQRAAICRALLNNPSVILADEPTGNLDPSHKKEIMDILLNYIRTNNATLIVATHDYELLDSFDQVIDFRNIRT